MDKDRKNVLQTSEIKNVLPDVVHFQQIVAMDSGDPADIDTGQNKSISVECNVESEAESISELIPSKIESLSDNEGNPQLPGLLTIEQDGYSYTSPNFDLTPTSGQGKQCTWNLDESPDIHISNESPVDLPLSSGTSNDTQKSKVTSVEDAPYIALENADNKYDETVLKQNTPDNSINYIDETHDKSNSVSDEIIKLDIRGKGAPKFPSAKIIFGTLSSCNNAISPNIALPILQNVIPTILPKPEGVQIEEIFDNNDINTEVKESEKSPSNSISSGSDKIEQDVLVEEVTVDFHTQRGDGYVKEKSFVPEETMSFSSLTDYKTICEDYHVKLVHLEEYVTKRDQVIEQLTLSLQQCALERDHLKHELQHLQLKNAEQSEHDTIKSQFSDFIKYQTMLRDDSTQFYSAVLSGTSSLRSSNGEKDNDCEEITVNHSKSDLRTGSISGEFQTGFENTIKGLLDEFEGCFDDDLKNKLKDLLSDVICNELGKMRIEYDADVKEHQIRTRKLSDLLSSVKAGSADIDDLRKELSLKYEKDMENLRRFFEKKCSDIKTRYFLC
ncbi:unnamed protein product [Leptidea sinapis]|uniref:Uncharacterized protein n=1 Tax=Leptidea sinapis TaxID=189913 RepID=A0A5E4PWG5_9NEOP|nr:unnamed protein product [Leptidea sinapis]